MNSLKGGGGFADINSLHYFRGQIILIKMKQYIYFLFASAVSIFGCTKHEQMADTFVRTEKQLETAPDSALHTLKNIPRKFLGNRAIRAKYSLLYTIAANRTKTDENTDSMLQIAWEYYRNHPKETRNRFRTLYYQAQSKLQKGDKPGALRQFLEVEEYLHSIDEPRYLGLLYLRIGDIYCSELNFVRAYRYYREARGLFMRTEDGKHTAEALLGMTASALRMNDLARDCSMALELADDAHDESLAQKSLGYFATLYVVADTVRIPEDLLRRIEQSVLCDTTVSGMCTRARTQLLRNPPFHRNGGTANPACRRPSHAALHGLPGEHAGGKLSGSGTADRPLHLPERFADPHRLAEFGRHDRKRVFPRTCGFLRLQAGAPEEKRAGGDRSRDSVARHCGLRFPATDTPAQGARRAAFASRAGDAGRISRPFRTHGAETAYRGPAERCDSFPVRNRGSHREDTLRTGKHRFRTGRDGSAGA